jgi:peptidyl-prolyl cis-trans isomerase B (cyclophilin B)
VGTDKRERQKANRQLKLEEMVKDARKRKTKRRSLQIGLGIPLLIVLVFVLVRVFGTDDDSNTVVTPQATAVESTTAAAAPSEPVCPNEDGTSPKTMAFTEAPPMCIDAAKTYTATVTTSKGSYTAVLDPVKAPLAVNNFVFLARYHYFDTTPCHRIIPAFVIQCGDPTGSGSGGPGYSFADELPGEGEYEVGSLAMANSGPDTNGSQFFVITGDQGVALPASYSLFGQVTDGLDTTVVALDATGTAGAGTPTEAVTIETVTISES